MNYISTRNKNIVKNDKVALLQGLSEDGGLFVLENERYVKDVFS